MQPSLYIIKKQKGLTTPSKKTVMRIVVVDHEKGKNYPANFVCVLPGQMGLPTCNFDKLFGDKSREIAKRLLTEALSRENDESVKSELRRRIRLLNHTVEEQI